MGYGGAGVSLLQSYRWRFVLLALRRSSRFFYPPLRAKILASEPWTADWRTVLLSDRTAGKSGIVVVIVDNKTLEGYPYTSPTPRDLIAKVRTNCGCRKKSSRDRAGFLFLSSATPQRLPIPIIPKSFALLVAKTVKPIDLPHPARIAWLLGPNADLDPFPTVPAETLFQNAGMDAATISRAQEQGTTSRR